MPALGSEAALVWSALGSGHWGRPPVGGAGSGAGGWGLEDGPLPRRSRTPQIDKLLPVEWTALKVSIQGWIELIHLAWSFTERAFLYMDSSLHCSIYLRSLCFNFIRIIQRTGGVAGRGKSGYASSRSAPSDSQRFSGCFSSRD